jgi:hypothetical protein
MRTTTSYALAVLTFLPAIYFGFFLVYLLYSSIATEAHDDFLFRSVLFLHFVTLIIVIGLVGVYVHNVYNNDSLTGDQKIIWTILILFAGVIAMPIYWYNHLYVNQKRTDEFSKAPGAPSKQL